MSLIRLPVLLVIGLLLGGCAVLPRAERVDYSATLPPGLAVRVELADTPFFPQDAYQCGPAALATVLNHAGVARTPQDLTEQVYLPARQGSLQPEMLAATRRAGLLPYLLHPSPRSILAEVSAGHPVVVLQNLRFNIWPQWHYAVVVGYDLGQDAIMLRSGTQRRLVLGVSEFDRSWAKADRWAFVVLPPGQLPATADETRYVSAAADLERVVPKAARVAYETALQRWPENRIARIGLGNVAYRQGDLAAAQAAYRQAADAHPDSGDAWNNLAQVLFEQGRGQGRFKEALEAARRAVELGGPRRAHYEATLRTIEAAMER